MWSSTRRLFSFSLHSFSSPTTASPCVLRSSRFSSSSTSNAPSLLEVDSSRVEVRVWWDFDTCKLPTGVNVVKVGPIITAALRANGIKGPIEITAFGNIWKFSRENQDTTLTLRTGINFNHVPRGGVSRVSQSIMFDFFDWVREHPPPSHLFLISGDMNLVSMLHRVRMENYNILVASTDGAMDILSTAATLTWHWKSLVKGKKIIGIRRNFPPDGFNDSWYGGHFEAPFEDDFSTFKSLQA